MYKAVFIDLDGTLLKKDHSISEETRAYLKLLTERNILIVLVSARPMHGIMPISKWLGMKPMPVISLNGSYIEEDGGPVFQSNLTAEVTAEIYECSKGFNVQLLYYTDEAWYAETLSAATEKEQKITDIPLSLMPYGEMQQHWNNGNGGPNKIMAVAEPEVITAFQATLKSLYNETLNIYPSKPIYLEIMNAEASKSNALQFVARRHHIRREETIAIGDNYNDEGMIVYAGMGVAMGNAPGHIKAVADYVTDTNDNDGVRKALEKFVPVW